MKLRTGRPSRIAGEVASERIWAWLTPRERKEMQRVADENGLRIGEVIREAVNAFVADYSDRRPFSVTVKSAQPSS